MDSEKYDILKTEQGEMYDQTDNNICVARKCLFVRWLKPTSIRELKFVSDNVLLIHAGKTLIFYDVNNQKENIVIAGTNSLIPSVSDDDNLVTIPLDSVACVGCCGIDLLALAEHPPTSKVIVCRYPDLKVLANLIDDSNPYSAGVKYMSFVKTEYLIGLRDYPAHDLIVWAWRIGEKLLAVNTGFVQPDQSLSVSDCGGDGVLLSVVERGVKSRLQLWQMFVSGRTVHAQRSPVDLPSGVHVGPGTRCWTPGESGRGWFVFCDSSADVYRVRPANAVASTAELCVEYHTVGGGEGTRVPALLCPLAQGFVLHAAGRLTGFNEVKGVFEKIWTVIWDRMLQSVVVADDYNFYGWSDERCEMKLNGEATNLCSNPLYYYVAISFKNGKVELLKTDPNESDIKMIATIVLSDEELSSINFFRDGKELLVTYFPTGRFYHIEIKLGSSCSVIRDHHLKKEVIDAKIFDGKKSSLLTVLYRENQEIAKDAGDTLLILNKNFGIVYKSFDSQYCYTSIFEWISFDSPGILNIALTMLMSFNIRVMTINIAEKEVLKYGTIPLDHDVRNIKISSWQNHCITFCDDGTFNIYEFNEDLQWNKIVKVNCSHWQTGGLIAAKVDGSGRNILTLSREGNFLCTSFRKTCNHARRDHQIGTPIITENMKTKGIGFEDVFGNSKRMTWTMIKQNKELEQQIQIKKRFSEEFENIKKKVLALYEENQNGPENERLDKEEFYLDDDEYGLWFIQRNEVKHDEEEPKMISDTIKNNMETEKIIKKFWDPLIVKPKSIHCIKSVFKVENFSIGIKDQKVIDKSTQIIENRIPLNLQFSKDEFKGSISHTLVDTIECLNSQCDYYKLDMAEDEIILLEFMITKLKNRFNKLFNDMFVEKQRTLDKLNGFNKRLRVIESEFRLACKIEPTAPSPVDYTFSQYEQTERLLYVEGDEVAVKMNLPIEKKSTEANEEINEQSLKEQNFRKQALIKMMDGVLQKRWEDELKKDVPKPYCMILNKKPKDYTVGDLKAINKYEEAVVALNNERLKYKIILQEEKDEIHKNIQESIEKLDENIKNLFEIKIKYDSAIKQEQLKILRISKMLNDSDERKQRVKLIEENCLQIEKTVSELTEKIGKIQKTIIDLSSSLNTLTETDGKLKVEFKTKFRKNAFIDVYELRPKMEGDPNYSSLAGYQFVDTIMDPTDDKLNILSSTFVNYLNTLNAYDDFKCIAENKLFISSERWSELCNCRRLKIKNEFQIINCKKEIMATTIFLENLNQEVKNNIALMEKLKTSIIELKNQDFLCQDDLEIQLILKKGSATGIKLTGHINDFDNVILLDKNVFLERTFALKEKELMKASKLSDLLKLKRKCQNISLDIDIYKQEIKLCVHRCEDIKHRTLTKNILYYQELKAKGISMIQDAEQNVEKRRAAFDFAQSKKQEVLKKKQIILDDKIKKLTKENKKMDCTRNKYLSEYSMIVKKIPKLREDIIVLKTKLKSLQLKVFPESES